MISDGFPGLPVLDHRLIPDLYRISRQSYI
jgi:hypothetical protein